LDSRTRRHMWVEFVVGPLICFESFSPGTPVFPSPHKPTFQNSFVASVGKCSPISARALDTFDT